MSCRHFGETLPRRETRPGVSWLHASVMGLATMLTAACGTPAPAPTATSAAAVAPDLGAALRRADLVDLSHTFDAATLVWPTSDPFRLEQVAAGMTPGGYYYASNIVHTTEHGGTHMDAPIHFAAGQATAEAVPLTRLVGAALVVDVTTQAGKDPDYLVTAGDLKTWEQAHGRIDRGSLVLIRTGWSARWPDAVKYLGTAGKGDAAVAHLHFPGLHPEAATFLVAERQIGAVGIDTASIDRGQSTTFEAHRVLAAAGVPGFENLTRLEALPARGAWLFALPMKIGGGSGGPLRAVAIVPRM
jgi:kynurenine formamidase